MKYLFLCLLLTGCASKQIITVEKQTLVEIPETFLTPCKLSEKPIEPEKFKKMSLDQKNLAMYAMADLFADALYACNSNIESIKSWQINQKLIFDKKE